ncbi:methyltransferase domain-containing protein [Granulicella arctica]|uniref:SAM-dependent methyltransferase n=1 Tax=Granulicella arctica TaxID=940613 RepID=A0A7Y9PHC1_9BACT|nr:methyltransferase domain-containing protein [Granulicella arctica]NYF79143.1 SAM-dependent methyltransferase [Granulicella arctica]
MSARVSAGELDLSRRADPETLPELMDQPCTYEELNACLRDIARVNRLTLAYRPTLSWLAELIGQSSVSIGPLHIVDVGCGHGDMLRRIHGWAARRGVAVNLTGIDLNPDAIRSAVEATPANQNIRWVHGDAFSYRPATGIDVVVSSLVMHHLSNAEIIPFLRWMEATARRGWFINDLHRTALPYRAFGWMTTLFDFHPFVQRDGLVSIRRSFLAEDWRRLCGAANLALEDLSIREYRPARLCVGRIKRE